MNIKELWAPALAALLMVTGMFLKMQHPKPSPEPVPVPVVVVDPTLVLTGDKVVDTTREAYVAFAQLMAADVYATLVKELKDGTLKTQQAYLDRFTELRKKAQTQAFGAKWDIAHNDAVGEDRWSVEKAAAFLESCQKGASKIQ